MNIVSDNTCDERYWKLAKLNTVDDKYDMRLLKNRMMNEMFKIKRSDMEPRVPSLPVIKYIYENTTQNASLRKLMVAWYAWHISFDWYGLEGTPMFLASVPDFVADLAVALGVKYGYPDQTPPFDLEISSLYEDQ